MVQGAAHLLMPFQLVHDVSQNHGLGALWTALAPCYPVAVPCVGLSFQKVTLQ